MTSPITSIKEALERIKRTALDAKPEDVPKALAHIVRLCIDADRTTVESGDARERIAKMICEDRGVDPMTLYQTSVYLPPYGMSYPEDGHFINWRNEREPMHYAYRRYERVADVILATGLAPDEVAIRADERERCAEIADCMADEYDATSFTSTNADQVAALRSKEQAAHEIAAAIRSGGGE